MWGRAVIAMVRQLQVRGLLELGLWIGHSGDLDSKEKIRYTLSVGLRVFFSFFLLVVRTSVVCRT